jgi:hypothetical protein
VSFLTNARSVTTGQNNGFHFQIPFKFIQAILKMPGGVDFENIIVVPAKFCQRAKNKIIPSNFWLAEIQIA